MKRLCLKDPGSAITHLIGIIMAILGGFSLFVFAFRKVDALSQISIFVYWLSMVLLYTSSTLYHALNLSEIGNRRLKKMDHLMIFVLIAGTYTPICLISLRGTVGFLLLAIIWSFALIGMLVKAFWIFCPKWFSSLLYIAMGWTCLIAFPRLLQALPVSAFLWLLSGGIIYTIGGILYALKLSVFDNKHPYFGSHEIFHLFVMGGSLCHLFVMYEIVS